MNEIELFIQDAEARLAWANNDTISLQYTRKHNLYEWRNIKETKHMAWMNENWYRINPASFMREKQRGGIGDK